MPPTRARILAVPLLLAACQAQSLRFSDVRPVLVEVEGWRIAVYDGGSEAQAIRMNAVAGASRAEMLVFGQRAIRQVTGCALRERGVAVNPSVLTGRIDCTPSASPAAGA